MAMINQTQGTAKDYSPMKAVPDRQSTADALDGVVATLSVAANELASVTDRLCGSQPGANASELRGVADGHFAQVDMSRHDIELITESILDSVSRIRGRL